MSTSGKIKLSAEVIVYETMSTGDAFELPVADLKAIFKHQSQKSPGYTFVNNKNIRKFVPITTEELTLLLDNLSRALKIARESFDFTETKEGASRIYLKPEKRNYQLLPDTYAKDQTEGYEVIAAKSIFCKWDTTIDELEKLGVLETSPVGNTGKKTIISYPVRIGRMLIDGLEIKSSQQRRDYPVNTFYTKITNTENNENSFYETYACLKQGADKNSKQSESITSNRMYIKLSSSDIIYQISYVLSGLHDFDMGHSTLIVGNARIYYDRLRTFDQFSTISPTTCHYFKSDVNIYNQLSNNELIGVSPKGLFNSENTSATIWVDDELGVIGFSQREYSYIFELDQVESFTISNLKPARGPGGSSLNVDFIEGREVNKSWLMMEGTYQSFDKSQAILEAMSGKPVHMAPEWLDD